MQSCLREPGEEQIRSRQAPDDRPLRPGGDPGGEQRRGRPIDGAGSPAREFVERSMRQTATRKDRVYFRNTEGKTASALRALALNGRDAFA